MSASSIQAAKRRNRTHEEARNLFDGDPGRVCRPTWAPINDMVRPPAATGLRCARPHPNFRRLVRGLSRRAGRLAIYEPFQWQEVISYLILGSERALLFDTGMGISAISEVVRELTALPVTVLNSHTHFDHIGGNAAFAQILAMDTDFTRRSAQGVAHEDVREEVSPEALCRPLPEGIDAATFRTAPFEVTRFIQDGHRIDLGDRTLEVLSIPGHTPDAVALLDEEAGFLWTDDSFYEGPIWLFVEETDLAAYGRSVERLAALVPQLTTLFPAHNTPVAKPERLVALREAFAQVQAGTVEGQDRRNGRVEYLFGDFSLLMRSSN